MQQIPKIIVAGSGGIGKTSILRRLCDGTYDDSEELTIGIDFFYKQIKSNDHPITLQLWDFAGQERFRFLLPEFVRGSTGAILGFDVSRRKSFLDLAKWINLLRERISDLPIVLVATKTDLKYHPTIKPEMAEKFVTNNGLVGFVEVSAKLGFNVEMPFLLLLEHLKTL